MAKEHNADLRGATGTVIDWSAMSAVEAIQSASAYALPLPGCAPTPLASYLKALGILRLVAEQADANAKGHWRCDTFVLTSQLDAAALEEFFLEHYRPTPIIAPWGARSGFYPGSSEASARAALQRIAASDLERLASFRDVIAQVRGLLSRLGISEKAKDEAKLELLRACRAELPDHLLPWLDACYVLTDEGRAFPPLLGTGGNEGSGSYVSGFAQQVVACIIEREHDHALAAALFGEARPGTGSDQTPGQFAPLAAGGPNASTGFEAGIMLNAWEYLLCLEGTLLFAAAATKRLEAASPGALAFPFTVHPVGAGAGSVALGDEPNARAETWFPLWGRPATLTELATVFAEGRVQVSGRTARDALDFARAVASLGMQRGITAFQRYGYLQRFGRNVFAVPLDRVEVRRNPRGDLADDLDADGWLDRFRALVRRAEAPARLRSVVSRLEDALFDLTRTDDPRRVQAVLARLGEAQMYLGRSPAGRDQVSPVPLLRAQWVHDADDGSAEFQIAAALAGLHAAAPEEDGDGRLVLRMASHFAPIDERRLRWAEGADHDVTWGPGNLLANLCALAERRLQAAARLNLPDGPWRGHTPAPLAAIGAWLDAALDDERIAELLPGLALARIPQRLRGVQFEDVPLPPAFAALKPLFVAREQLARARLLRPAGLTPDGGSGASRSRDSAVIVRLLSADRVADAVELGLRRLRLMGLAPLASLRETAHPDGQRLLAALLVPLSDHDLRRLARRITRDDEEADRTPSTLDVEA